MEKPFNYHTLQLKAIIERNHKPKEKPIKKTQLIVKDMEKNNLNKDLSHCTVSGNVVFLPNIKEYQMLDYQEVRKALLNAGAKYKNNSFVFPNDAQQYIDRITEGEKVNIKKEFQFFATPSELAKDLVFYADLKQHDTILEPSAGQGAIIKEINKVCEVVPDCFELMDINRNVLSNSGAKFNLIGFDFLEVPKSKKWTKIIANPPFIKNQDIDHVNKMYNSLSNGGRIVSIMSTSWTTGNKKKQVQFREFLENVNAEVLDIPKGTFKESGTMVGGKIVIIDK